MSDPVYWPAHYNRGKIQPIDFIEDQQLGFHLAQVVKYVTRAGKKDKAALVEDLQKARWYLDRLITMHGADSAACDAVPEPIDDEPTSPSLPLPPGSLPPYLPLSYSKLKGMTFVPVAGIKDSFIVGATAQLDDMEATEAARRDRERMSAAEHNLDNLREIRDEVAAQHAARDLKDHDRARTLVLQVRHNPDGSFCTVKEIPEL